MKTESFRKILIVGNRLIGDSVDTLHAFHSFLQVYDSDETEYSFLGYSYSAFAYKAVLERRKSFVRHYFIDAEEDSKTGYLYPRTKGASLALLSMRRELAREKFDLALIYPGGFIFAFIAFLAGISNKIGLSGDWRSFFLDRHVRSSRKKANYQNFFALNDLFHTSIPERPFQFSVHAEVEKSLNKRFSLQAERYMVVAPCASEASKTWPGKSFFNLSALLASRYKVTIVWLGMQSEYDYIAAISKQAGLNLAGRLNWEELIVILAKASFFIGNDSGLAHIAAMYKPCFVVCGPSNVVLSKSYGENAHMIFDDFGLPSEWRKRKKFANLLNINALSVERVFGEVSKLLSLKRKQRAT